jgi:glycosyltransferase involved in cell wall biosynthesis
MAVLPLSVFIIAKNEEDRIPHALNSVIGWADEVIVVDSGSSDGTVAISDKMGAKAMFHEWQGYGPQKRFAESQCRNRWILNIDADEAVSPELRQEIVALFAAGEPPLAGYHIPICIVFPGDEKPRSFAPSNSPIRLYDRQRGGFADALVHDSVILKPGEKAGKLKGMMFHRCFRSHRHALEKINYYSSMQAEDMLAKGRVPGVLRLIAEPWVAFCKAYFLRRYVLFGVPGFTESVMYAFARFIRLAKARELARDKAAEAHSPEV